MPSARSVGHLSIHQLVRSSLGPQPGAAVPLGARPRRRAIPATTCRSHGRGHGIRDGNPSLRSQALRSGRLVSSGNISNLKRTTIESS
jgi:hypothetical protein